MVVVLLLARLAAACDWDRVGRHIVDGQCHGAHDLARHGHLVGAARVVAPRELPTGHGVLPSAVAHGARHAAHIAIRP